MTKSERQPSYLRATKRLTVGSLQRTGFVFMWVAAGLEILTAMLTPAPDANIQKLVQDIRIPGRN